MRVHGCMCVNVFERACVCVYILVIACMNLSVCGGRMCDYACTCAYMCPCACCACERLYLCVRLSVPACASHCVPECVSLGLNVYVFAGLCVSADVCVGVCMCECVSMRAFMYASNRVCVFIPTSVSMCVRPKWVCVGVHGCVSMRVNVCFCRL